MTEPALLESIALQIADGDDVSWEVDAGPYNGDVIDNLHVLEKLARTLREQDAAPDMPASWGSLEIVSHLGSGASADVFRAHDRNLQRDVALKLFRNRDEASQQRLLDEGRMMARVKHPNIVQVFGAERHDGRIGLWMELVEGQTLDEIVDQQGPMSAPEAALVGRQLCAALAAVHKQGLLFRDIKLQNVIREKGGTIKLTDFGSGLDNDQPDRGRISGTPLYIAPELFDDEPASVQSDIYALGVLLYCLVSGEFPVEAESIDDLQEAHRGGHRLLLDARPDLPAAFASSIEQAINKEPGQRFASVGEFSIALRDSSSPPKISRRRVIGIVLLLALAATVLVTSPSQYQLDTRLLRLAENNVVVALEDGAVVTVGDNLVLELTATVPLYVYIFNEDTRGNAWGLYPLDMAGEAGPLSAGATHRLPGKDLAWTVDTAGIIERIHILASPGFDEQVAGQFAALPPARLADAGFGTRGIGSISRRDEAQAVSARPMIQLSQELAEEGEMLSGVSYRVIELQNPE
jgi:tRNA A-37 threonylcarbamoyl transferase component Bud32/sulfur transfer complex TusBCD TusB component (DsrH family)